MSTIENNFRNKFLTIFLIMIIFSGFCYICVKQTQEYNERCQTKLLASYSQDSSLSKEEFLQVTQESLKKAPTFGFLAVFGLGRLAPC